MHEFLTNLINQILTIFVANYQPKEHPYIMAFLKGLGSMVIFIQLSILLTWRDISWDTWLGLTIIVGFGFGAVLGLFLLLLQVLGVNGEKYLKYLKKKGWWLPWWK